jgi:hypothetical protein
MQNERVTARPAGEAVIWKSSSRPWRVVPLALFAVAMTVAFTGAAAHIFRGLDGDQSPVQILADQVHSILR